MEIPAGTHTFGPDNGALWVKTGRAGAAAAAGHDLLIHVTSWQATLEIAEDPAQSSIAVDVDARSLRVREGIGGMQELGDDDKENIQATIDEEVLKGTEIGFRSTALEIPGDGDRIGVHGDLTLMGSVRPLELDLVVDDDGKLTGSVVFKQSDWGMAPYSALFGALKVADEVEIVVNASWDEAASGDLAEAPDWDTPLDVDWQPTPIIDPGISSFVWALIFFLYLWLGMATVGVARGTALALALVASFFIFMYVRTRGVGREDG